jgi:hypothetical protein
MDLSGKFNPKHIYIAILKDLGVKNTHTGNRRP